MSLLLKVMSGGWGAHFDVLFLHTHSAHNSKTFASLQLYLLVWKLLVLQSCLYMLLHSGFVVWQRKAKR